MTFPVAIPGRLPRGLGGPALLWILVAGVLPACSERALGPADPRFPWFPQTAVPLEMRTSEPPANPQSGPDAEMPISPGPYAQEANILPPESKELGRNPSEEIRPGFQGLVGNPAFSPDGQFCAYGYRAGAGGEPILHVGPVSGPVESTGHATSGEIYWSPDSRRLAFFQRIPGIPPAYAMRSWDVLARRFGTLREIVMTSSPWAAWVDRGFLSIEGTGLEGAPHITDLVFVPHDGLPAARLGAVKESGGGGRAFPAPDGSRVAFLAPLPGFMAAASLVVHDLRDQTARAIRRVPSDVGPLVWTVAGDALGFLQGEWGQFALHKISLADGSEEVTPFNLGEPVIEQGPARMVIGPTASHLSPDLRWCLVSRGGPLYAREMATGKHVRLTSGPVLPLTWTADGRHVFVATMDSHGATRRIFKVQVER